MEFGSDTRPVDLGTPWQVPPSRGHRTLMAVLSGLVILTLTVIGLLWHWNAQLRKPTIAVETGPVVAPAKSGYDFFRSAQQNAGANEWEQALENADSARNFLKDVKPYPKAMLGEVDALRAKASDHISTKQLEDAENALRSGNFVLALSCARNAGETVDRNHGPSAKKARALVMMARVYEHTKDLAQAESFYRQASQVDRAHTYTTQIQRLTKAMEPAEPTPAAEEPVVVVTPNLDGDGVVIPAGRRGRGGYHPSAPTSPQPQPSPAQKRRSPPPPVYIPPPPPDEPLHKYKSNSFNG